MELSSSDKERIQHQYDALAKKTLVGEAKSYRRTLAKRAAREVTFSDLSESELAQLFTTDEYESDYYRFQVSGFDVLVKNELLAEALSYLIKEIQIYPNGTSDRILKSIEFNFPIYRDGREIRKLLWENGNTVETVCLLSKLNVKHHIEVEITMDELDLTAAESKATYDEIKAYVLEKFGFKVSQLYIAQIKRKCGIIERKNYNQSKKEDAKVPKCPPEKEAAIMDALKHFQMIP